MEILCSHLSTAFLSKDRHSMMLVVLRYVWLWYFDTRFFNTLQSDRRSEPNTVQRKITRPNNAHSKGDGRAEKPISF